MDPDRTRSAFFDHAPVGMALLDADGTIREANPRLAELLDRTLDGLCGAPLACFTSGRETRALEQLLQAAAGDAATTQRGEFALLPASGPPRWMELWLAHMPSGTQEPLLTLTVTDIDERKAAEAEHDELERFYEQTFTTNVAVKLLIDPEDGRIVDANPAAANFYGWPIEELKRRKIQEINTLSADEVKAEMTHAAAEERLYFRFRHRIASDEIRDVEVYSGPVWLRGKQYLHSIVHDVTETRRYLRQLERYKAIFDTLPVGVYRNLPGDHGHFDYVNPAMARIFGASSTEELLAHPTATLYRDPAERRRFSEDLLTRGEVQRRELALQTLDGRPIQCAITARAHQTEEGWVFDGVVEDISERVLAKREREELLEILEASPDLIGMADPDGRILYQNPALNRATGVTGVPGEGETGIQEFHPEWARGLLLEEALPAAARDGVWQGETALLAPDGTLTPASQTVVAHRDDQGTVRRYSTIIRDISALKEAQVFRQQLLQNLAEGVFGLDDQGRYTFLNPAACQLLGFAREADALGLESHATTHHTRSDGTPYPAEECPIYRVQQTGEPLQAWEDTFWRLDGTAFPTLVYAAPLRGVDGAPEGVVVSFQDITERVQQRERLKSIARHLPGVIYQYREEADGTASFPYLSEGLEALLGIARSGSGVDAETVLTHAHPEDRVRMWALAAHSRVTLEPWQQRLRVHHPERGEVWIEGRSTPERLPDGSTQWNGVLVDITPQMQLEALLREEKAFSDAVLRNLPGVFYMIDADGRFVRWNERLEQVTGLHGDTQLAQVAPAELFPEPDRAEVEQRIRQVFAEGRADTEARFIHHADGSLTPYYLTGYRVELDGQAYLIGVGLDISERMATEEALRSSEAELKEAQRIARLGNWISDFRVNEIRWSEEVYRIFGRSPEDGRVTHQTFMQAVHPDDRERVQAALEASFEGAPYDVIHRVVHPDGTVRVVRDRGYTELDADGTPARMLGTVQDITEQRELENSLRRLVAILDSTPDLVSMHDPDGRMVYLNAAGRRMVGLPVPASDDHWTPETGWNRAGLPAELDTLESTLARAHPPEALERTRNEAMPAAMEHGVWQGETEIKGADGHPIPASQVLLVQRDENGEIAQISTIIRDISARKQAERELERSNAELEQFAYAVSHDLQEPLRIINSYLGLLERRYSEALDDKARRYIDTSTDAAARMQRMIRELLEYSRIKRMGEPFREVALDDALDEACRNLERAIRERDAQIRRDPLPVVQGDSGQLMRLFQNLLSNAIKYGPPDAAPQIRVECRADAGHWQVTITDNGIGIDPAHSERIFGVFQRLHGRDEYEGTGAGLALARRIAERHGGALHAESAGEGQGTTLRLTLPRTTGPAPLGQPRGEDG